MNSLTIDFLSVLWKSDFSSTPVEHFQCVWCIKCCFSPNWLFRIWPWKKEYTFYWLLHPKTHINSLRTGIHSKCSVWGERRTTFVTLKTPTLRWAYLTKLLMLLHITPQKKSDFQAINSRSSFSTLTFRIYATHQHKTFEFFIKYFLARIDFPL